MESHLKDRLAVKDHVQGIGLGNRSRITERTHLKTAMLAFIISGAKSPGRYNKYLSTGVRWGVSDRETGRRQLGRQQGFDPGPSTEKTCTETVGKEPAPWTGLWRTAARSTWNFSVETGCCWVHGAPVNCYCAPTRLVPASPFVLLALKHGCRNPPPIE